MAAEREIIQHSKGQWFPDEVKALRCNLAIKRHSQLYKLDPSLQDGILRVGGWLEKSAVPQDAKHPAILSKHSRAATLILHDIYEKIGHCGRSYMSQLRQRFWIPRANSGSLYQTAQFAEDYEAKLVNRKWQISQRSSPTR